MGTSAIVSLAFVTLAVIHFHGRPSEARALRFQVSLPDKVSLQLVDVPVVSSDGQNLVFVGTSPDFPNGAGPAPLEIGARRRRLWLRSFDSLTAQPLPGTEDSAAPFWSPDSRLSFDTSTHRAALQSPEPTYCEGRGNYSNCSKRSPALSRKLCRSSKWNN